MQSHAHRGHFVAPDKTMQLMASLGATRAAEILGVSTTLLYTARQHNEVSKVVEVAAAGALKAPLGRLAANDPRPEPTPPTAAPKVPTPEPVALVLMEVAHSKLPVVEKLAKALHAPILVS